MRVLLLGALLCLLSARESGAAQATFSLVPAEHWNNGKPAPRSFLPDGRIYLYRAGAFAPELIAEANVPTEVPAGQWLWIAEAVGYVSTGSGILTVDSDPRSPSKRLVWPVVPACELVLDEGRQWHPVQRLDIASLSFHSVYPVTPATRRRLWVPAGRFLGYSVGPRGLIGISRPRSCRQNERIRFAAPSPPPADRQDFIAHVTLPSEATKGGQLAVFVRPVRRGRGGADASPAAAIWQGSRGSFFFLDVSAEHAVKLTVNQPTLRSASAELPAAGGSAREFPEQKLKPRRSLTLSIDYRPSRPHRSARVLAYHCGRRRQDDPYQSGNGCHQVQQDVNLIAGRQEYVLRHLDDGQYLVHAVIDDEIVYGLGHWVAPYLSPDDDLPPELPPVRLAELTIEGHLLAGGKPVAGEVRLVPVEEGLAPMRRAPTDEDLLYRLYYFGHLPASGHLQQLPEAARKRPRHELYGLYRLYAMEACDQRSYCRLFNLQSSWTGEGRMDLEIGGESEVDFEIVSAEDGAPIPGAMVGLQTGPPLRFLAGETEWAQPRSKEGAVTYSDAHGHARVRLSQARKQSFGVVKKGYKLYRGALETFPRMRSKLRVRLVPDAPEEGIALRFPDGSPAASAFLLVLNRDGSRNLGCSRAAGINGVVEIPQACLEGTVIALLHPRARIQELAGTDLQRLSELTVPFAPGPLRLRAVDAEGRPVAGLPVGLRFRSFTLGPDDLLLAMTYSGSLLFYLTDSQGEMYLQGIDPAAPDAPDLVPLVKGAGSPLPLAGHTAGESIELRIDV